MATVATGLFSLGIGTVHLWVPTLFRYPLAIGSDDDGPELGQIGFGSARYQIRRRDLVGLAWVMSNAASYVLLTVGLVDLAWSTGWRGR